MIPCPKCGQDKEFIANSNQVQEDLCEVWITCICGHDPHHPNDRLESVMGSLDKDTIIDAIGCWEQSIEDN